MKQLLMLVACVVFAIGSCFAGDTGNEGKQLGTNGGRYVFGQINGLARHIYMLDTQTGRLWELISEEKVNRRFLSPVCYLGANGKALGLEPFDPEYELSTVIKPETKAPVTSGTVLFDDLSPAKSGTKQP